MGQPRADTYMSQLGADTDMSQPWADTDMGQPWADTDMGQPGADTYKSAATTGRAQGHLFCFLKKYTFWMFQVCVDYRACSSLLFIILFGFPSLPGSASYAVCAIYAVCGRTLGSQPGPPPIAPRDEILR